MAVLPPRLSAPSSNGQDIYGVFGATQPAITLSGAGFSVTFLDNEHPSELPMNPLTEQLAVHPMIGGFRKVQDLGPQPDPISWEGTFWDAQAADKVATIQAMEKAGQPLTLTWYTLRLTVLISKFLPVALHQWRIKYSITLEVVGDNQTTAQPSVDSQTLGLYTSAQSNLAALQVLSAKSSKVPVLDSSVQVKVNSLGTLLNTIGPIARAAQSDIANVTGAVAALQKILGPYASSLLSTINATTSGVIDQDLQQAYGFTTNLVSAISLIGQNVQGGQAPRVVQVAGGTSLYHLSALHLGDATLAPLLKSANNLTAMVVPAGASFPLKIPPAQRNPLS